MTEQPAVSVVIPAFNAERFLGEAIESILAQTLPPEQILVVDDASGDRTVAVAASYHEVEVLRLEANAGPAGARNAGFSRATGDLISFHDADDMMLPHKLEVQATYLREHPEAGVVLGTQEIILEGGADLPFWHRDTSSPVIMPPERAPSDDPTHVHPMTMLVRRETFELVGGFDPETSPAEDLDWMLRASEAGIEIARLEDVLIRRRVHPASLTQDAAASRQAIFRAFKARIDRSRKA